MTSQTIRAVSLRRILPSTSFVACADVATVHATDHHQQCRPGSLFVAIRGTKHDGRKFVNEAIRNGAAAILVDEPQAGVDVPQCIVPDVRAAFSTVCLALASRPDRNVDVTGVTGTNGKTTVTWLLRSIFETAGRTCGLVGTVEFSDGKTAVPAQQTTPGPTEFSRLLSNMSANGVSNAFVEISSHALDQKRLAGLRLASAVLTNVTQDHFDYHGGFEGYLSAKEKIADYCTYQSPIIVNSDDERCRLLIQRWNRRRVVSFGLNPGAEARGSLLAATPDGSAVRFELFGEQFECEIKLPGRYNVSNCVAAATVAKLAGIPNDMIARGLSQVAFVPGRLQPVKLGQDFRVFIDYAHTPDGLTNVIEAVRPTTSGRLFCVFGAGGDRDRGKRPLLARAASNADVVVVTSDNPRSEDPSAIVADVCSGLTNGTQHIEVDRGAAIHWAVSNAKAGDCVLIVGRGHETEQQIGDKHVSFDDRTVATEAIKLHHSRVRAPHSQSARVGSWTQ